MARRCGQIQHSDVEANANDPAKVRELAARINGFAKAEERIAAKMRELLDRERDGAAAAPPAGASHSPETTSTHP